MSNRLIRINELIQREISAYLRKRWAKEAATITISGAEITPDLKECKVFVSILGSDEEAQARHRWLVKHTGELRREVGRHVVLKWTPEIQVILDASPHRAGRVMQILDELDRQEKTRQTEG